MTMDEKNIILILILSFCFILLFYNQSYAYCLEPNNTFTYQGPGYCLECHPKEMEDWLTSAHSVSYTNSSFQSSWKEIGSPEQCLICHTTDYMSGLGFKDASVSCEECHGPGNTMQINKTVSLCAKCHTDPFPTFEEWKESWPQHRNATCYTCHTPHSTKLTLGTSSATCGQCHSDIHDEVAVTMHGDYNVECSDCHMYFIPANFLTGTPAQTGHTFEATKAHLNCTECHAISLYKHNVLGTDSFACLACHGAIHSLELKLVNGTTYPDSEPAKLCGQCHIQRYIWWSEGIHIETHVANSNATCTECHDPHDPLIYNIPTLSLIPPRPPGPKPMYLTLTAAFVIVEILLLLAYVWRG